MGKVYYGSFGGPDGPTATGGKSPFYLQPDPVAAFLIGLQKSLGVPETGTWDVATQTALWGWVLARETFGDSPPRTNLPPTLPFRVHVCAPDGFPIPSAEDAEAVAKFRPTGTPVDCVETVAVVADAIENYWTATPSFVTILGWDSPEAASGDTAWQGAQEEMGLRIAAFIRAKLSGEVPAECPEGTVRMPDGSCQEMPEPIQEEPPVAQVQKAGVGWIVGGLLLLGGIGLAVHHYAKKPKEPRE